MADSPDVLTLAAQMGKFDTAEGQLPPIESWDPKFSGAMDMLIKKDGSWWHEGDLIKRDKLSRLFSSILKVEEGLFYLVTPVEKWQIQVEDMPFVISLAENVVKDGQATITLMTNMGSVLDLDAANSLTLDDMGLPLIEVRNGLMARLNRNVYYQLAELALENADGRYEVESGGVKHILG